MHCVSDAAGLYSVLLKAASNGQHDVIRLVRGQYNGGFFYDSSEALDLTILGGYNASCGSRMVDPANTVLDGATPCGRVLELSASKPADFVLEGVTLRNGGGGGGDYCEDGGGLWARTTGMVVLRKSILNGNRGWWDYGTGGVIYASEVRLENKRFEITLGVHQEAWL